MSPGADFYQCWPLARQNTGSGSAWDAVTKTKWAGVSLSFDLGGTVFGLADITTTAGALVFLSGIGVDRSLVFTGVGDGFDSGSLDFKNGATDLSFGPTGS